MKEPSWVIGKRINSSIEAKIRDEVSKTFSEKLAPENVMKIGTEAFLIFCSTGLMKVRVSFSKDTKRRDHPFKESLEFHEQLQKKFPEVPKIIKYVDRGDWKFKFVEWIEGQTFSDLGRAFGGGEKIPVEYYNKFGTFMFKVRKLGIYGKDGQSSHALYRPDMDVVILCDLGSWSFSREKANEVKFLRKFLRHATQEQKDAFYAGLQDKR